jgi:hypothetical protein
LLQLPQSLHIRRHHAGIFLLLAFRQIVDSSLVAAPKQRNTKNEMDDIKAGRIPTAWKDKPAKLRQKDSDARWTVKFTKGKPQADDTVPSIDIAIPAFGNEYHISIDRGYGLICKWLATDVAAYEGARLREGLLDKTNTSKSVWADTAYRSAANEAVTDKDGFVSRVHRKKLKGRPMPEASSMSSPNRRAAWGCSSEPSASRERRPRSGWPISHTI